MKTKVQFHIRHNGKFRLVETEMESEHPVVMDFEQFKEFRKKFNRVPRQLVYQDVHGEWWPVEFER